ncbi:rod shape-determining protein MreC [Bacillus sp. FJAT-42376]|uniref:rod shape-determining protein MreC n=1 Tax=Bacillus sp. FJAT-42376 TaxID=2014076 RepID=UPI000F4E68AF|nr:rod shape-determining protein MreC [Bacillus sp. FJAT-42376]AZB43790.1 rod shape-determining protein MreC [Bacillus sp. FJAT-42376]
MPPFFMNKRLILLLASVILLVALIGFSVKGNRELTWPEKFVKDSTGLFQSVFHKPAQFIGGTFEEIAALKDTYNENQYLKSRIEKYATLDAEVQRLRKENGKLREDLGAKTNLSAFKPIIGTMIARNPDRWYEYITLDRGTKNGVTEDMAVMTSKGLIGKIKSADAYTSTVQLLSAQDRVNQVPAVVESDKNIFGLIAGYDEKREMLLFRNINTSMKIKKGDKVVTAGNGGVFPLGLAIGTVEDVQPDSYGLTKMAYVKPAADFYDVENVIIIKREAPVPPEGDVSDGAAEGEAN